MILAHEVLVADKSAQHLKCNGGSESDDTGKKSAKNNGATCETS
jgi:hypothetical protein